MTFWEPSGLSKSDKDKCWKSNTTWHEDGIVVPSDCIPALLKWTHESSGHVGADCTLKLFKKWFHSKWSDDQLRKTLQPIASLTQACT